jgi:hypothetical protein
MRINIVRAVLLVVTAVFACAIANAQTPTETTVYGTDKYPKDVHAVQRAVDKFDVVTLSGTFNFGYASYPSTPAGTIFMTRPNAVLKGPATIIGGGSPSDPSYYWPVIDVTAPDVTVRDLKLVDSADTGIYVHGWVGPSTTPTGVTIRGNTISAEWGGIFVEAYRLSGSDPIKILENNVSSRFFAVGLNYTGGLPIEIRDNTLAGDLNAIRSRWNGHYFDWTDWQVFEGMSPLDIIDNDIVIGGGEYWYWLPDAIMIYGWDVHPLNLPPDLPAGTDPAEWGDNGPVTISGNLLTCLPALPGQFTSAIQIGRSASGLNHSLVSNNTIKGECHLGITKWPYGSNNAIIGNDLSGLTTHFEQIGVQAHDTTVAYNILGATHEPPALFMWSVNQHPAPDPLDTPMPRPLENCTIMDNDYRQTGLPGWSEGGGAIMVASDADLGWAWGVGTEVRNNYIDETGMFPQGTGGAANQIFQYIVGSDPLVHDNRIVGLPADHVPNPGIGQRIKSARSEMILQGITELENKK